MVPGRVLVVDDEPDVRTVCRRGLGQLGYEVVEAGSGAEAIALAHEMPFDLVVLDFKMPGMDGLETYRAVKAQLPDVIGVMITAYAAVDNAVEAVNLGLAGFVLKPFKLQDLQKIVQEALEKRQRDQEQARATMLGSLARLSASLSGQDLEAALRDVMEVAREQTHSHSACVLLWPADQAEPAQQFCSGVRLECDAAVLRSLGDVDTRLVPSDDRSSPSALRAALKQANLSGLALARLALQQQPPLGLLWVGREVGAAPYSHGDLEVLRVLAAQTAIMVSNVRLLGQVVEGQRLNQSLASYLSPRTVQAVMSGQTEPGALGGAEMMTVLLADVVDFSTLVEHAELERIIEVMHEYFSSAVGIITAHQGVVDELSGDEILATFDRRAGEADDALRAIKAGLEMLQRLEELRSDWARRGMPFFDIGIGISSGQVTLGSIGSGDRRALVTAGRILNLAARSQAMTRQAGLSLIITQGTFEQVRDSIAYRELGAARLKGIDEPVGLYGVCGLKGGT